ncbi:hypothetical protein COW36_05315 [bacterium (Candidatus Blackallbacteria) CG17_big_fil_post_rev_8_21_14_2_50_48_46]|uniref:Uncharacterized protein n=1 Tax=bacterium (Candidatus Blackallbacteria) CG17_big_fil_post_rev_8_21_14_2_50_48_46 TaxID=2014261 RepID=A0A2M7G9C7_9BACT|nr:MAG: hypothetical protein COW64_03625 [bacterium (Candidatus Blackallbacteria) CG18_big_fil_WC_8_21_14_2_50_49_26]PIW18716.1 MAG: hypothetical protein COW36_05315 [bacterium (Candidatus Blackallbacteria) CG17_big_fil_post_rev_8_21_14_2_50_48_46]PIW46298.1 MAG: hypothetical protein COW20_15365 [bacterium (Candidatus Blackallbacteria) CG13_big_fil_rev_8_21_14_2_50_49_14]
MKKETRENYVDKLIGTYFDQLWSNPFYLNGMGQLMRNNLAMRQQWNKQMETLLSFWQLPNQQMQQRTLHQINTLLSEWRFERDELNDRLDAMEKELAELKTTQSTTQRKEEPKRAHKSGNAQAE